MKFFIVLLFSCYAAFVFSQSTSNLDLAGGFKDFKIGDPKSKWVNNLGSKNSRLSNTYTYTGSCCTTAFGKKVSAIGLSFNDHDKLVEIFVEMQDRCQGEDVQQFLNTIKASFGRQTSVDVKNDNSGDMTYEWDGDKVVMAFVGKYKGADNGGWAITLIFIDEKKTTNPTKDY